MNEEMPRRVIRRAAPFGGSHFPRANGTTGVEFLLRARIRIRSIFAGLTLSGRQGPLRGRSCRQCQPDCRKQQSDKQFVASMPHESLRRIEFDGQDNARRKRCCP